jgi:hypothetical protein
MRSGAHERSLRMILDASVDAAAIDTTVQEQHVAIRPSNRRRLRANPLHGPSGRGLVVAVKMRRPAQQSLR